MASIEFPSVRISLRALQRHQDGFLRSLRRKRPETRATYERALRSFLQWFQDDGSCRFRVADIERYKRYLTKKKRLSDVSVSTYLTAVRRLCGFLVREGILSDNPGKMVGGSHRPLSHSRETLTPTEVQAVIRTVLTDVADDAGQRSLRDLAFVKLMVSCGLSEIEIIRADVQDLHHEGENTVLWVQGKGRVHKDAPVALPSDVGAIIERYIASRGDLKPSDPLFTSAGNRTWGERMTTRGVRERINRYLGAAGVKNGKNGKVTPGSLRHTAALLMAASGATADEIMDRMRLGSIETAMLYVNQNTQLQRTE